MTLRVELRSHAVFLEAPTGVRWRTLGADELGRLLAEQWPWNVRPARVGDELVMLGSLAVLGEVGARRPWLAEQVEAAARRMQRRAPEAPRRAAVPPSPGALATLRALAALRALADAKDWSVRGAEELEIDPGDDAGVVLRAAPVEGGVAIHADAASPLRFAPDPESAGVLAVAALGLNARLHAARLRLADAGRSHYVAEVLVPGGDMSDDELDFALEGVRHAALEATNTLGCLVHAAVAREYAAAFDLSLG